MEEPRKMFSHHPMAHFQELISEKYPSRQVTSEDPIPIPMGCNQGPLYITYNLVMCDVCGGILRSNYLRQHRNSGACYRKAKKERSNFL